MDTLGDLREGKEVSSVSQSHHLWALTQTSSPPLCWPLMTLRLSFSHLLGGVRVSTESSWQVGAVWCWCDMGPMQCCCQSPWTGRATMELLSPLSPPGPGKGPWPLRSLLLANLCPTQRSPWPKTRVAQSCFLKNTLPIMSSHVKYLLGQ